MLVSVEGVGGYNTVECLYAEQTAAHSHVMTCLITEGGSSSSSSRALYKRKLPYTQLKKV